MGITTHATHFMYGTTILMFSVQSLYNQMRYLANSKTVSAYTLNQPCVPWGRTATVHKTLGWGMITNITVGFR